MESFLRILQFCGLHSQSIDFWDIKKLMLPRVKSHTPKLTPRVWKIHIILDVSLVKNCGIWSSTVLFVCLSTPVRFNTSSSSVSSPYAFSSNLCSSNTLHYRYQSGLTLVRTLHLPLPNLFSLSVPCLSQIFSSSDWCSSNALENINHHTPHLIGPLGLLFVSNSRVPGGKKWALANKACILSHHSVVFQLGQNKKHFICSLLIFITTCAIDKKGVFVQDKPWPVHDWGSASVCKSKNFLRRRDGWCVKRINHWLLNIHRIHYFPEIVLSLKFPLLSVEYW